MSLTPCSDLSPADWITSNAAPWGQLVSLGPAGFDAYARLRFIPDPSYAGQQESDAEFDDDVTETEQLRILFEMLARHTSTPGDCYFLLWDGWGLWGPGPEPGWPKVVVTALIEARHLEVRSYFLFRGPLSDLGDWARFETGPNRAADEMPDPAFVWPADRAWCVANDVDPHWAGIAARPQAIAELTTDPGLDIVATDPDEDRPSYN